MTVLDLTFVVHGLGAIDDCYQNQSFVAASNYWSRSLLTDVGGVEFRCSSIENWITKTNSTDDRITPAMFRVRRLRVCCVNDRLLTKQSTIECEKMLRLTPPLRK